MQKKIKIVLAIYSKSIFGVNTESIVHSLPSTLVSARKPRQTLLERLICLKRLIEESKETQCTPQKKFINIAGLE